MTELEGRIKKRIKVESRDELEEASVKCKEEKTDNVAFTDEPDYFQFGDINFKVASNNEDSNDAMIGRKRAKKHKSKRFKVEPSDEHRSERVEFKHKKNQMVKFPNERIDFDFQRVHFKVESDDDDSVDAILERKRAEEQLPPVTIENLRNLVIKLRHNVPPQHQIERSAGSHVLSSSEREAFQELLSKRTIKNGVFTPEEDQLIVDNWKAFCNIHNWDQENPKPFLYMRHNGAFYLKRESERRKFVQFLADGLPRRTLYSVYHRFRNLYDSPKLRTKYNRQEDEYIIKHIEHNKNLDKTRMFADLAKVLNRTRASVWRRYRLLKQKRSIDDLFAR